MTSSVSSVEVETATKQKTPFTQLPMKAFCAVSALGATTMAAHAAPIQQDDYEDMFGDDYNSSANLSAESTKTTAQSLYGLLKVVLVLIGLFIFAGGILQLVKANKSQGQISPAAGWTMVFAGAALSIAGALFFALGSGLRETLIN